MRIDRFGAGLVVLVLAALPASAGDNVHTAPRLAEIEAAQKATSQRYSAELQKAERTKEATGASHGTVSPRAERQCRSRVRVSPTPNPHDPAAFKALKIVIRTNRQGRATRLREPSRWSWKASTFATRTSAVISHRSLCPSFSIRMRRESCAACLKKTRASRNAAKRVSGWLTTCIIKQGWCRHSQEAG